MRGNLNELRQRTSLVLVVATILVVGATTSTSEFLCLNRFKLPRIGLHAGRSRRPYSNATRFSTPRRTPLFGVQNPGAPDQFKVSPTICASKLRWPRPTPGKCGNRPFKLQELYLSSFAATRTH